MQHALFGGIGMATFLGWNPLARAAIFALGAALGIEWAGWRVKIREDSAIGMAALTAFAIVFSIRAVGIVLLISLLTFPAVIINSITRSFPVIAVWSCVVAVGAGIAGLWASWMWNIPTGAATIFALVILLIAAKALPLHRKK